MGSHIGVQTSVEALPWASYSWRGAKQEWSMGFWGWGSGTAEVGYTLINVIGTFDRSSGAVGLTVAATEIPPSTC